MSELNLFEFILLLFVCFMGVYVLAGFLYWRKPDGTKEHFWCYHDLVTGGGGMGDGVDCLKCGLATYDGFNGHLWLFWLLRRIDRSS